MFHTCGLSGIACPSHGNKQLLVLYVYTSAASNVVVPVKKWNRHHLEAACSWLLFLPCTALLREETLTHPVYLWTQLDSHAALQVLNRASVGLALLGFAGVFTIFMVLLIGRNSGAGYAIVTAFVIFVAVVPIGMPVVTTTVLAVGARGMAKEKAVVAR